ncbi:hypothetical protein [Indiicoccus explosivorum]|nr:hypothetical protein [Indiicoccus explosivorum]
MYQGLLFMFVAGMLTFIMAGGVSEMLITNLLLGFIAGVLVQRFGESEGK